MPLLSALLIAPLMCLALLARAEAPAVSEQALKAVLFYKLPLFVYSGAGDKRNPINICTLGEAPLGDAPGKLPATLADGRRVDLRSLATATDADDCQYVFIGRSEAARLDSLLRRLSGRRMVTVSDIEGFAVAGGMVEFTLRADGSGLLILINRKAAQKQGIEFNAQLLRLAKIVEP
jgi:hypothetical protein